MAEAVTAIRDSFTRERRKGIGGSDVAAIFGLDPYRTPEELWLEKTGQLIPVDEPSGDKERGIRLEPIAAELYAKKQAEQGRGVTLNRIHTALVHPDYGWMRANIDRLLIPNDTAIRQNEVVEIKCPSLGMYSKLKREGLPYRWTLQAQHYLCVTGLSRCVWVIFCADRWELIDFPVERDELMIDRIIEKEREFWTFVETMSPPPNVIAEVVDQKIVVVGSVTKRSDEEFVTAINHLKEAKAVAKSGEELYEMAKTNVLDLVENKPGIYSVAGVGRVNFAEREGRKGFDHKALAGAKPLDRLLVGAILTPYFENGKLPEAIIKQIAEANLDLTQFETQGKPFTDFRFYGGKEE